MPGTALFPFLLALLLCRGPTAQEATGSLEAYLTRVRDQREAERARLQPQVEDLVKRLGQSRSTSEVRNLQAEVERLGSEALPLLVPFLDPGSKATAEKEKQASEVAAILIRTRPAGLLEELVRLAESASPKGRPFALRVLGESPEKAEALDALRTLHTGLQGALRAECLQAIDRLDGSDPRLVEALSDPHPAVVSAGLRALADEPRKAPRPEVLSLLTDPSRGADVLVELVQYFSFPGQEHEEESVATLVRFATREDLSAETRLKVLDGLPRFGVTLSSRLRREVEPLLESSDSALRDGALVALTLMKDAKARRELLRFFDDQVKESPNWPLAYQRRGDIELRIGEYKDAIRDYEEALRLHGDSARLTGNRDLWINLARAQIKDAKLKAAADTLEEFTLSSDLRRTLKADPDFQPLVEHPKYKSLFE